MIGDCESKTKMVFHENCGAFDKMDERVELSN